MKKALLFLLVLFTLGTALQAGEPSGEIIGDKGPSIRYYPNPIQKVLTLEVQLEYLNQYSSVEVKIVNLLGQEMVEPISQDLNGLNHEIKIDLTDVPSGVYFLEVYSFINGNSVKQTRKITRS
ncbi:MAG: T9SS type A sorting domain-containing protein [Bacteroidota bacterium]|nr:T9SS type A sorting domain-containing protein [Bacteroidota bacterium]MDX5429653.1 T9SS type A sorting domain-containing protein [Bacteroidota bacterium]MDX5468434.1 T9SS type A sorting domain-containing protein [Bacteroidota bacterium]